jgi:hypothetical protein
MTTFCHIPSDQEVGLTERNSKRRALALCVCAICNGDYEVRDGRWYDTRDAIGDSFKIKICPECYRDRLEKHRHLVAEGKKLLF